MKLKGREKIFELVSKELKNNPLQTILQISKATGINWETVKYAIRDMNIIGVIECNLQNGKEFYSFKGYNPHPLASKMLNELIIKRHLGASLICPLCKKKGSFGIIRTIIEEDKREWVVCGYCNKISKEFKNE